MEGEKKRGGWWALAGAGVLTLLGLYVGAYFVLVQPAALWGDVIPFYAVPVGTEYQVGVLFHPIHCVDRWLRPAVWTAPPGSP